MLLIDRLRTVMTNDFVASRSLVDLPGLIGGHLAGQDPLTNPLVTDQVYLDNPDGIDLNVIPVWADYTGSGVAVVVVDDGVDYDHQDLNGNFDTSTDFDFRSGDDDADAEINSTTGDDFHGTGVASIIAADNDGVGMVGVAYEATLSAFRLGFGQGASSPTSAFIQAISDSAAFDISNNSWEAAALIGDNPGIQPGYHTALLNGVETGRDGLGTIYVFAAGNGGGNGDNVNAHALQASRHTIAVGAYQEELDLRPFGFGYVGPFAANFTNPGAAVLVSGQGTDVFLADPVGTAGLSTTDYNTIQGTSFSAPQASGLVALMLEANPDLGWRDVQKILAISGDFLDDSGVAFNAMVDDLPSAPDGGFLVWEENGADIVNGGGLHYSHVYGYGAMDATAAVRLAETWTEQGTSANEQQVSASSDTVLQVGAGAPVISDTISVTEDLVIQAIEVTLDLTHSFLDDLKITLVGPDGNQSVLFSFNAQGVFGVDSSVITDVFYSSGGQLTFTTVGHLFESTVGDWTLVVEDKFAPLDDGVLNGWTIDFYGDQVSDDDTLFITDDYSLFAAADASRASLNGGAGLDSLNAAALGSDQIVDLTGGTGLLDGIAVTVESIENLYGGDGNDQFSGSAAANLLDGGRGDDTLDGGDGDDTLAGDAGNDILAGGAGVDTALYRHDLADYLITYQDDGGLTVSHTGTADLTPGFIDGTDTVDGIEFLQFADQIFDVEANRPAPLTLISGTAARDRLIGTAEAERFEAGAGSDLILTNGGDDEIVSGGGNDQIYLSVGAQTIELLDGDGFDSVLGFVVGEDVIDYSNTAATGMGDLMILAAGSSTYVSHNGSDFLILRSVAASQLSADDFLF